MTTKKRINGLYHRNKFMWKIALYYYLIASKFGYYFVVYDDRNRVISIGSDTGLEFLWDYGYGIGLHNKKLGEWIIYHTKQDWRPKGGKQ